MTEPLHDFRFPGESEEYRRARDELLQAEIDLRRQIERVAAQRRELPTGGLVPTDYEFTEWGGAGPAPIRLSELFAADKNTLYLYSFMVVPEDQGLPFVGPCPSCTSIIDGLDGAIPHISQRVNVAVCSIAPIERFRAHGASRGWRHTRLLSSAGNTYNLDYGAANQAGHQWPLATVFVKRADGIHHAWSSELFFAKSEPGEQARHVDYMWPVWTVFDRTPVGRGTDWGPSLEYT